VLALIASSGQRTSATVTLVLFGPAVAIPAMDPVGLLLLLLLLATLSFIALRGRNQNHQRRAGEKQHV